MNALPNHVDKDTTEKCVVGSTKEKSPTEPCQEKQVENLLNWAKLFCAKSWEEAIEVAEGSEAMQEAVVTMWELSKDEKIRQQCQDRTQDDEGMESAGQVGE